MPESQEQSREIQKEILFEEIDSLISNPPRIEEVIEHEKRLQAEQEEFLAGKKTEHQERLTAKTPGSIRIPDFDLLYLALVEKIGMPEDVVADLIEHEKAHYDQAKKHGLRPKIYLNRYQFVDEEGNNVSVTTPYIAVSIPEGMEKEEARKLVEESVDAPQEKSTSDTELLKRLQN
ncbi:MAG: hypothetical protein PHN19_05645 [Patescibacteria group bacterium]|nr:hypothetical protein [Patescibacteria group bacterium]